MSRHVVFSEFRSISYEASPSNREPVLEHKVRLSHGVVMKIRKCEGRSEKKARAWTRKAQLSLLLNEVNPIFHHDVYGLAYVYTLC